MALCLLSTLTLLVAVEDGRPRWWVLHGACVCLAAYTHYTAVFVLAAQFAWAFWVHPRARRPLLVSTAAAALVFAPWLPSLRGDLDSPTTEILSVLSPLDPGSVGMAVAQWGIGFPAANIGLRLQLAVSGSSLRDFPGIPALVLVAASLGVGLWGLLSTRSRLRPWFAGRGGHLGLVVLLALATPVGTALQSAAGTNVFRTRSLAPSWPYLALAVAALITVGRPALRALAAGLAVAGMGIAAVTMTTTDFQRPDYRSLAQLVEDRGGVVVNGAVFTPGPLTNFDLEGSTPSVEVFRLTVPEQRSTPFVIGEARPDPADVARRAALATDGGPITVIAFRPPAAEVTELIEHLPPDYGLTDRVVIQGLFDLQALVYERSAEPG
jgi:4-amino-4-deoxy-L-arabinose transferase-like glycosyltransferase